jgi:hypothetical protein
MKKAEGRRQRAKISKKDKEKGQKDAYMRPYLFLISFY